jgi:lipid-A-disaccharide synthase
MFIAGDPSGDIYAAPVIKRLREQDSSIEVWGIGGPFMVKEGFTPLMPFEPFNKMGFKEVISHLGFFLDAKKKLIDQMKKHKPDCLVCIDYPGFNMPMMKAAYKIGIPVVWYIAPMVWAWKKKRAAVLGKCATYIACIFPFEVQYFLPYTDNVGFVGNPSVESMEPVSIKRDTGNLKIAIVPGSRKQEVEKMLPVMLDAFRIIRNEFPSATAIVSHFSLLDESLFEIVKNYEGVTLVKKPLRDILSDSSHAIVTSGTATLETALLGVPMAIIYRTSKMTHFIVKSFLKIKFIGLPNIIAGKEIVPECIQENANPEQIASRIRKFIKNNEYCSETLDELFKLKNDLGVQKPSFEVAEIIRKYAVYQ